MRILANSLHKAALRSSLCVAALLPFALAAPAHAAGTLAGTPIDNTATATYDDGNGGTISEDSNTVTITVDEILDVAVTSADSGDIAVNPGDTDAVLTFTVTNGGNGPEAVVLTIDDALGGDDFDPDAVTLYISADGTGPYDPSNDTLYNPSNPPILAPDQTIRVYILGDIPTTVSNGNRSEVGLTGTAATAVPNPGTPGTVFPGAGEGGTNAVVGATGAQNEDSGFYAVTDTDIDLVKQATVADPFGGATQVPGSIITYTLTSDVTGSGSLPNVVITDAIPVGTTYVMGSLTLDGPTLTDPSDADAGEFNGTGISVNLGNVTAPATNVITFQVEINSN